MPWGYLGRQKNVRGRRVKRKVLLLKKVAGFEKLVVCLCVVAVEGDGVC